MTFYEALNTIPVVIYDKHYYKQKRTHHNKFINFLFKKIYGMKKVYCMKDMEIINCDGRLYVNPNTYEMLRGAIENENK